MFYNYVSQSFFSQLTILKHHSHKISAPAMSQAQGEFLWIKRALGGVDDEISWTRSSLDCSDQITFYLETEWIVRILT